MNNALDEHSELNYNKFKRKSNDWKDSFLSKAILETYSRYGNKKNLSRRSWYNLRSGMKNITFRFVPCLRIIHLNFKSGFIQTFLDNCLPVNFFKKNDQIST